VIGRRAAGFPASLYVHLPFCSRKCAYCDFFSVPGADAGTIEKTLDSELRELEFLLETYSPRPVPTLYVGGGTPSVVPRDILGSFLRRLVARLPSAPGEFTVEANPESLDEDFIGTVAEAGANRLSLGIQTFDAERLRRLERAAAPEDGEKALELLSRRWTGDINLDLMYGFPGQTEKEARGDLERILTARPGHVSLYALTVEEEPPLHRRIRGGEEQDVDCDRQEAIRDVLHERLLREGFSDYEISNYAVPGRECRHNLRYWRLRPYMGLGPGGVSTLPGESSAPVRLAKEKDIGHYLRDPVDYEVEKISPRDFLVDYLLMGFRTRRGIDRAAFTGVFGDDPVCFFPRSREKNSSFFIVTDESIALSDPGLRMLNTILLDIMDELDRMELPAHVRWPEPETGES